MRVINEWTAGPEAEVEVEVAASGLEPQDETSRSASGASAGGPC